ncbi:hypothetical protein D0862_11346 [Hortaea werneckii]|uniref:Magnesium transport protein CorA n=1 Tax=Hortaea werneckii TaxID=91943 RepID=A0A3M7D321_HORWE|nr:hypothetical protein D0863_12188 [Hortaea werneckii]RMY84735.1 hypothetical protein D0862_11346 [Hortaea werneckii]
MNARCSAYGALRTIGWKSARHTVRVPKGSLVATGPILSVQSTVLKKSRRRSYHDNLGLSSSCFRASNIRPFSTTALRLYHAASESRQRIVGAEPGSQTELEEAQNESDAEPNAQIKIIDYCADRVEQHNIPASALDGYGRKLGKPAWAACRWIYVNGLDTNVVTTLGNEEGLHRLALEDVLHTTTPTKVDWYKDHCFIVMTLQKLVELRRETQARRLSNPLEHLPHTRSNPRHQKWTTLTPRKHSVSVEQVSLFLRSDNTVITIFERSGPEILQPILTRLDSSKTIIRSSNDASTLVQAVIDTIIDISLPIGKDFSDAFGELEQEVLMNPTVNQSTEIYTLRSELSRFRDLIVPIGAVVRTLRDVHAMGRPVNSGADDSHNASQNPNETPQNGPANHSGVFPKPLISPVTRTYLSDVHDHITTLTTTTYALIRSAENLTSLIFNLITAKQNESVRQLTIVSTFFLPLTFLTGYFGMNFDPMPIVNNHSDVMFWYIATPVMASIALMMIARSAWASRRLGRLWRRKSAERQKAGRKS